MLREKAGPGPSPGSPTDEAAVGQTPEALRTPRTHLLPATRQSLQLLLRDRGAFVETLEADFAPDWDELEFENWAPHVLDDMKPGPDEVGWWLWWVVASAGDVTRNRNQFIGHVGFKGPPTPGGNVELMYGLAPSARQQGLASEAVGELLHWASRSPHVRQVLATVAPDNTRSLRLLFAQGFKRKEDECDEEEWVLGRELAR